MKKNSTQSIKSSAPVGASLVVLSSIFYASYGVWSKLMGSFFGGYTASALRSILVLLMLVPVAVIHDTWEPINLNRTWRYLVGIFVASLFIWGPLYYAFLHAGVGISSTINYASYVIGMFFFGWLFVKERFTRDKFLSAVLGLIGLGLVFSPNITSIGWLALGAALISGVAMSANMVISKQMPYGATQTNGAIWILSVLANTLMAFVFHEAHPSFSWHIQWLYLLGFAVASVIASWSFIKGLKLVEAGAAGVLGLLEIVFGVLFGIVLFKERPGALVLLGIGVIITAAAIPYFRDFNSKHGTLD